MNKLQQYKYPHPLPQQHVLSIFYISHIQHELADILAAIQLEHQPPGDPTKQQWSVFITYLVGCFNVSTPGIDAWEHALSLAERPLAVALGQKVLKLLDALPNIVDMLEVQFEDQAVLLLPTSYAQRFEMLLGEGRIPVAAITQFDLLRF